MSKTFFVAVRTFPDRIEAELAHSALEAAGIDSMIKSDDAGGLQPGLSMTNGISVMVRVEDAVAAAEILTTPPKQSR